MHTMSVSFGSIDFSHPPQATNLVEDEEEDPKDKIHVRITGSGNTVKRYYATNTFKRDQNGVKIYTVNDSGVSLTPNIAINSVVKHANNSKEKLFNLLENFDPNDIASFLLGKGFDFKAYLPSPVDENNFEKLKNAKQK